MSGFLEGQELEKALLSFVKSQGSAPDPAKVRAHSPHAELECEGAASPNVKPNKYPNFIPQLFCYVRAANGHLRQGLLLEISPDRESAGGLGQLV